MESRSASLTRYGGANVAVEGMFSVATSIIAGARYVHDLPHYASSGFIHPPRDTNRRRSQVEKNITLAEAGCTV